MKEALQETTVGRKKVSSRITIAWIIGLLALGLAGWLGQALRNSEFDSFLSHVLQALVMSGIVITGVWYLRKKFDRGTPQSIGLESIKKSLLKFGLGMGLILVPLILTLTLVAIFDWGTITFNADQDTLVNILGGMAIVLTFEALPEELLFRGYIYSNLNARHKRWLAALMTIGLFALLPVLLYPLQKYVLGMEMEIGGSDTLTVGYVINMIFFGAFVQYLRILTGSVWTGIGFHLIFVYMNHLIGLDATSFIQLSEIESEQPMQITLIISILVIFIGLLLYPRLSKRRIGWKELAD